MKIKTGMESDYKNWLDVNDDPYGRACFTYAERWAGLLEARINDGMPADAAIQEHAEADSHTADEEGITGFMYGMAVSILAHCWEHGELLRRWHNLAMQMGTEGERANENGTVLNPAMISVG